MAANIQAIGKKERDMVKVINSMPKMLNLISLKGKNRMNMMAFLRKERNMEKGNIPGVMVIFIKDIGGMIRNLQENNIINWEL